MYIELIDLYLLTLFSFLISTTSLLIVIEIWNQEIQLTKRQCYMKPVKQEIIHIHRDAIKFAQSIKLPLKWELEHMHPSHIEHMRERALDIFVKQLIEHVEITEYKQPMDPYDELRMEIYILQKR